MNERVISESFQESACRDHAGIHTANIFDVCHIGFDQFIIFFPERKLCNAFTDLFTGFFQLFHRPDGIFLHGYDPVFTNRTQCRTGKCGSIDHQLRIIFFCIAQGIGKDHSSLCIGVDHLHGKAAVHCDNITADVSISIGTVIRRRKEGDHMNIQAQAGDGIQC